MSDEQAAKINRCGNILSTKLELTVSVPAQANT